MDRPALDVVKPGVKTQLTGCLVDELIRFPTKLPENVARVTPSTPVHVAGCGHTVYIDGSLETSECAMLCSSIESSEHLTFWNSDESKQDSARLYRDADTIEVDGTDLGNLLWERVSKVMTFPDFTFGKDSMLQQVATTTHRLFLLT